LQSLLRRDDILYNVVPVAGYEELAQQFKEYVEDQDEVPPPPLSPAPAGDATHRPMLAHLASPRLSSADSEYLPDQLWCGD